MTRARKLPVNRAQFIRDHIQASPDITHAEVEEAWITAGFPANKAPAKTQFYSVRKKMRLNGSPASTSPAKADRSPAKPRKGKLKINSDAFRRVEDQLDQLIQDARTLQSSEVVDSLRQARRTLYQSSMS